VEDDAPGLEAHEVHHVVDEAEEMRLTPANAAEVLHLRLGDRTLDPHLQQLGVSGDRVERRA